MVAHEEGEEISAPAPVSESGPGAAPTDAVPPASPPAAPEGAQPVAGLPGAAPAGTPPAPALPEQPAAAAPVAPATTEAGTAPAGLTQEQQRMQALERLTELYAMPDAEAEELRVNPGVVLPKLAAKLHYEVFTAMSQGLQMVLPQMIGQVMQQRQASTEVEGKFFGAWPKLKDAVEANPQAQTTVVNAIRAIRSLNPNMSMDEVIANAGLAAMVSLKIPLDAPGASAPATPVVPAAPVAPTIPARPPGAGAVGHVPGQMPAPGGEENIFAGLAEAHERGEI